MVNRQELLEYAKVFDHYYGTPRGPVEEALSAGRDVLFDIDWQGTQQLDERAREDLVSVFILPPSTAELERRLNTRAQDSAEVISNRMAKAADEMTHWSEYDYVVVNQSFEDSVGQIQAILAAERLKRTRQEGLSDFVRLLRQGR
jgi:guanylate kinase